MFYGKNSKIKIYRILILSVLAIAISVSHILNQVLEREKSLLASEVAEREAVIASIAQSEDVDAKINQLDQLLLDKERGAHEFFSSYGLLLQVDKLLRNSEVVLKNLAQNNSGSREIKEGFEAQKFNLNISGSLSQIISFTEELEHHSPNLIVENISVKIDEGEVAADLSIVVYRRIWTD